MLSSSTFVVTVTKSSMGTPLNSVIPAALNLSSRAFRLRSSWQEIPTKVSVLMPCRNRISLSLVKLFCRPCRKLTAVVLPLFEVRTAGRVNALLECAEFPVKRPRPHWNGTVRVYDTLHLIPGFLRVGSEHLRLSALALGGFE